MLAREDHALLREILTLGHELEAAWAERSSRADSTIPQNLDADLAALEKLIRKSSLSKSPDLRRLEKWADHFTPSMTARHFSGLLVPFERLSQRSLRDDEFLLANAPDNRSRIYERLSLVPVLENIRSAFNVGAIFRTAECWGLGQVILTGYTPGPDNGKTSKTSMGTGAIVNWAHRETTFLANQDLKARSYTVVALETIRSAESLPDFKFPEKTALLLGNERFGLDPDSIATADKVLRIPLRGQKNSLNVGIAFGIAAYEYARQWGKE